MCTESPRPKSIEPSVPTAAGRLRLCIRNDGEWWTLFDPRATRDDVVQVFTGLGVFRSPLVWGDFLENNTVKNIVRHLWKDAGTQVVKVPSQVEMGFDRFKEVLFGRDPTRRALSLILALTPLCSTSPLDLKSALDEPTDMGVMCGHDDETRMTWLWFKSLLSTTLAFFWQGIESPTSAVRIDRDTVEVNDILDRASRRRSRHKWKQVEQQQDRDGDWLKASFEGNYRCNRTRCWWRDVLNFCMRETSLDEFIVARITGLCSEVGLSGMWLEGHDDLVLTPWDLKPLLISTDPWERKDRVRMPLTEGDSQHFQLPMEFKPSALLPPPRVHQSTGIPFELLRGFPCVAKERQLMA